MDTFLWECLFAVVKFIETYFDSKVEYPFAGYDIPRLFEHLVSLRPKFCDYLCMCLILQINVTRIVPVQLLRKQSFSGAVSFLSCKSSLSGVI